jgi:hypothetical protein
VTIAGSEIDMKIVNDQGNKEQRRAERLICREDILIDGLTQCAIADISEGGLFISTIQCFEKDEVIEVAIPTKRENITVRTQVKYCQSGIGAGVAFIDLNDEQRAKIKELIESIEKG